MPEKRNERGMSQEVLSFDANIHKNQIGIIERGEINPTLITLNKISLDLETPLKDLFEFQIFSVNLSFLCASVVKPCVTSPTPEYSALYSSFLRPSGGRLFQGRCLLPLKQDGLFPVFLSHLIPLG